MLERALLKKTREKLMRRNTHDELTYIPQIKVLRTEQITETGDEKRTRFHSELYSYPEAQLQHFKPVRVERGVPRDRFGNRVFTSPDKSYTDREGRPIKAALLVSREGENFLRNNPGILNDIDRGVQILTEKEKQPYYLQTDEVVDLGRRRKLKKFLSYTYVDGSLKYAERDFEGGQSIVYVLETPDNKYVIKKHTTNQKEVRAYQPYFNEMLQTQAVATDFKQELQAINIRMADIMFASGQLMCQRYVEGKEVSSNKFMNAFIDNLRVYIADENHTTDLWHNIDPDQFPRNFIQQRNGLYVWIDPFRYLTQTCF